MKCWNCLQDTPPKVYTCPSCGEPLKPNPAQAVAANGRLAYLLSESAAWSFLPPSARQELERVYQARKERLREVAEGASVAYWPLSDWTSPVETLPEPVSAQRVEEVEPEVVTAAPPEATAHARTEKLHQISRLVRPEVEPEYPVAVSQPEASTVAVGEAQEAIAPPAPDSLSSKVLAEADIRWFHSLGALLVVAAVVGWLRATWDGYGKDLAGLLILSSPLAMHALARQMRRSVPLSARLLSILAGLLTAPALLAAQVFDFLPPQVSGSDYWTFSFLVAAALLGWQAQSLKERVPLYVGTLCLVMAGWSQGALATSALCLMVGFLLAPVKASDAAEESEVAWAEDLRKVGFAAGLFGCFSALFLFRPEHTLWVPLGAFTAALAYLHLPTLTRQADGVSESRVAWQAGITVMGMLLMRFLLDVPAGGVGLYALLAAGLFLAAKPESQAGLAALRFGSGLGLVGLALGFFSQLPPQVEQIAADPGPTVMRFLLALVGAALFGKLSREEHLHSQRQTLAATAMFATFGGAYHLFYLLAQPPRASAVVAGLGLWVVVWLVASRWLRPHERQLVEKLCAPVLLGLSALAVVAGLALGIPSVVWCKVAFWLGCVALLWERGIWNRVATSAEPDPQPSRLHLHLLTRLSLWTLSLSLVLSGVVPSPNVSLALQVMALLLSLGPFSVYRRPGLEMVWLVTPFVLRHQWEHTAYPAHLLGVLLVMVSAWAAPAEVRRGCLALSSLLGLGVLVASIGPASPLALATLPLAYTLALVVPAPQRSWEDAGPAKHGLDALLCAIVFLPTELAPKSAASLLLTVAIPVAAFAIGWSTRFPLARRAFTSATPYALLLCGFVWSLGQGSTELGLLLLLGSVGMFRLNDPNVPRTRTRDFANGMAVWGLCWVLSPSLTQMNMTALLVGALLSEGVALLRSDWKPNVSNAIVWLVGCFPLWRPLTEAEVGLLLLGSLLTMLRGLSEAQPAVSLLGAFVALSQIDAQLSGMDASLKVRVLPLSSLLIGVGLWLSLRPEHPARAAFKVDPLGLLRLATALLSIPPLLGLAVSADFLDFVWVLTVGCSCLGLSALCSSQPELGRTWRQLGGWVLTAWAVVSLGRAALQLPWQLATLVVGLVLLALGVVVERRRKARSGEPVHGVEATRQGEGLPSSSSQSEPNGETTDKDHTL